MSGRVDQFVAAMITGWSPTGRDDTDFQKIVDAALKFDRMIADHEFREIQDLRTTPGHAETTVMHVVQCPKCKSKNIKLDKPHGYDYYEYHCIDCDTFMEIK